MSRRTYAVRRAVALTLAVAMVMVSVVALRALAGALSDGERDASSVAPSTTAAAPAADGTAPSATDASPTATSPATPAEAGGPPTPERPATVYIAGDSDAGTFGPYLERLLATTGVTTTTLDYKVSSGLARPDFFDWPARFAAQLPLIDPDIVVVTFGGNDAQPINGHGVESDEWRAEYGRRVGAVMDLLGAEGRTLIWVGIPNAASADMTARMEVQDQVVRAQAAQRPAVVFIDTWNRFSGRNGGYAEFVIDPRDGQGKDVRAGDGFHLNENGAEILALDIAAAVREDLRARGAAI